MRILLLSLIFILTQQKSIRITYNHSIHTIKLYTSKGKPINFKLSFETQDFSIHQSLKGEEFYLENNNKAKLISDSLIKYDYKIRPGSTEDDDTVGQIGLNEGSTFFSMLKKSLHTDQVKLQFKHKQGAINIINQTCKYPLFTPLKITLSQTTTHTYNINFFSLNFTPDSSILKLIGKDKNPFEVTAAEMNNQITISIRDRIISVPFKELFSCGKYLNSDSYQCQITTREIGDMGGLMLYFDPIVCSSGIELHRSIDDSWGFHYSHIILLILQFSILAGLVHEEKVVGVLNRLLMRQKNH